MGKCRLWSLVLLTGLAAAGCSSARASRAQAEARTTEGPPVAVRLTRIERGAIARPIRGTGVLRLKREMDLSFKVGGVVAAMLVDEGVYVKRGQTLARLDPTEVDAALRQAKEGTSKAERDLDRVRRLHATGALPLVELQNAETGLALAKAGTDSAAFNAQRATLVAPDDGRIDRRLSEAGEVVGPGRPVFRMSGQSKGAVVRIGVTDRDVLRVRAGDVARVVLDARPAAPLEGSVAQVATVASPGSGTFDLEVKLADPPDLVLSGLTAKVEIPKDEAASAIVPIGALSFETADRTCVYVVEGGRARKVAVKIAFLAGDRAAIDPGDHALDAQAEVVDAGAAQLEEGRRVKVIP